jgi:1-acyl-sn-glycerol-3-phosphate acyltransferase
MTLRAKLATWILALFGWRVLSTPPPAQKGVVIIYPHTSNWDFILGVLARAVLGLRMHWVGKHTLFKWPFESVMRWLGGIPVDRSSPHGMVGQLQQEIARYDQIFITMTPEGTRKHTQYWKSGFYHIAHGLKLPLGLATFNYQKRVVDITNWINLTGDVERDMETIRGIYKDTHGKFPALAGEIRLKE